MTRGLFALGYATLALCLALSDHRTWAALVVAAAAGHLTRGGRGGRPGLVLSPTSATLDHWVPHSQGGLDTIDNLVTACWSCNRDKGNRTPEQWLAGVVVDTTARERAFIPPEVRQAVYARDGWTCRYCGTEVT